jgi:hypothetical protein
MPTLVATYNVRYYWNVPNDVVLLPVNATGYDKTEREGYWYIKHATLHYYWKGKWSEIEGTEDGFTCCAPNDAEFQDD